LPEIDIATSLVIAVVVVAGVVLLARRPDVALRTRKSRGSRQRRKAMNTSPSSTTSGGTGFSIRWGRLTIFTLGALALLVAVVTGIAGIFGAGTWLTAGISLLITAASYAALRGLVILDSKRRARERERLSISEGVETSIAHYQAETSQAQGRIEANEGVFAVAEERDPPEAAPVAETQEPVEPAGTPVPAGKPLPRALYGEAGGRTRGARRTRKPRQEP